MPVVTHIQFDPEARRQRALDRYAIVDTAPEQAFDDIVQLAVTLCGTPAAAITLIDHQRLWFKARIGIDQAELPREGSLCSHVIDAPNDTLVRPDLADDPHYARRRRINGQPPRFYAGVPLLSPDGEPLGVVCVADVVPRTLTDAQRQGLELLARQTRHLLELRRVMAEQGRRLHAREAAADAAEQARVELQRRHEALRASALRDPLTGLLNRAAAEELLQAALRRPARERVPYSLLVLDIDHFKQVNDQLGHLAGDEVLRGVAAAISASIRPQDVAVRFGGEELLAYLPSVSPDAAARIAERIRTRIAATQFPLAVTVSIGIAGGNPATEAIEDVFNRADQALYRAKAAGRDRVVVDRHASAA